MSEFSTKAKRIIALLFCSNILFGVSIFFVWQAASSKAAPVAPPPESEVEAEAPVRAADVVGNFTDEMKIPYTAYVDELELREERGGDHPGSPYFYNFDFYNAKNTDTLTILPHFRTIQQAKNFTCGVVSIQMVLDYFGKMGDWNEENLAALRPDHDEQHLGLCLDQLIDIFNQVGGFELETTYDYQSDNYWYVMPELFQNYIKAGIPVIVGWIDRGGHWMVIIGYDDMGTPLYSYDDVFILADSSDTTDHNADGYTVVNAQRLFSCFSFYTLRDLEDHQADYCFIAAKPIDSDLQFPEVS